jgi:hypothetical protein
MILITGKSTLARSLADRLEDCVIVGRPEYDFSTQAGCDRLLHDFADPRAVINTFATINDECWTSLTTNYVAPVYLTVSYYKQLCQGHIINISSTSSWWPSYPGISDSSLYYGISKLNLSEFGKHFNRSIVDSTKPVVVTTIEPGRFKSPMSGHAGMEIDRIVELVEYALRSQINYISLIK